MGNHYLQEFTFNNIYVRHAVNYRPDDNCCVMHIHSRCEIFYFVSGELSISLRAQDIR